MQVQSMCRRACVLTALALVVSAAASAVEFTKDEIDFRKNIFVNKKGERLEYRLYVPLTYSKERNFPLVLWLRRRRPWLRQRTPDHQKQRKRFALWTSQENQLKFSAFWRPNGPLATTGPILSKMSQARHCC
jgi:predicted peptidase